jgi:hypothetical protein
LINNLTASWAVTPKANLALTYRYGNRNIGLNLNVTPTTTRTIFAITEQAMVLQGSYRVTNNLDFNGTFEAAYNDNAFTAMTPRQLRRYRAHTTYRPTKWATIAATYTDTERHNNTNNEVAGFYSQPTTNYYEGPLKHVDFTRTGGFSAELTPNEHFAFDFDYVYADVFTATNICYAGQDSGFLTGTTSPYFANAASVTSTGAPSVCYSTTSATPPAVPTVTVTQWLGRAFMDAPTQHGTGAIVISPTNKLKYGVGYQINSVNGSQFFTDARGVNGALHSTYETPYMSLDWIARPGFIWKAQWNYYGYGEGGHSGAPFCTLNSVATATAANIVPCGNEPVPTGMNSSNAGMTAPRDFHANNITLGIHYDF